MSIPIGQFLVESGAITEAQRDAILEEQDRTGRPFGEIAETRFGISPDVIEDAWAEQYAAMTRWVNLGAEQIDPNALSLMSRRQAWQFKMIPVRYDGAELMICTTTRALARALRFACRHVPARVFFVLAEPEELDEALMEYYAFPGFTPAMIESAVKGIG